MYPQIKVFVNTNENEVNQFLKENSELTPVIVSAQMIALPGRSNMLQAQLTVIVQLHGEDVEAVVEGEAVAASAELLAKTEEPKVDVPKTEVPKVETPAV